MLEYNIDDAEVLLEKNLTAATKSLTQVDEDLGFLRDQTTTIEVSILSCKTYLFEQGNVILDYVTVCMKPAITTDLADVFEGKYFMNYAIGRTQFFMVSSFC